MTVLQEVHLGEEELLSSNCGCYSAKFPFFCNCLTQEINTLHSLEMSGTTQPTTCTTPRTICIFPSTTIRMSGTTQPTTCTTPRTICIFPSTTIRMSGTTQPTTCTTPRTICIFPSTTIRMSHFSC